MSTNRRQLLKSSGLAVGALTFGCEKKSNTSNPGSTTLPYPNSFVAKGDELHTGLPKRFYYPDRESPCLLLRLPKPTASGVGPERDIVGFSQMCSHQGCPVSYDPATVRLQCPCHYTLFDPESQGAIICGQATAPLAQVLLSYDDENEEIRAFGMRGVIYGRQANVLT